MIFIGLGNIELDLIIRIYPFAVKFVRTKFDLDMIPIETDPHLRIRQMSLDLSSPNHIPLNVRIAEFCEDPQNMDEMSAFIDDILKNAQIEATARLERKNKVHATQNVVQIKMNLSGLAILLTNETKKEKTMMFLFFDDERPSQRKKNVINFIFFGKFVNANENKYSSNCKINISPKKF